MNLYLVAICAGISFGSWPIVMKHSGLTGYKAAAIFCVICTLVIAPFTIIYGEQTQGVKWWLVCLAGILGGIGVVAINKLLGLSENKNLGTFLTIALTVQVMVPILYQAVIGSYTSKQILGLLLTAIGIYLLK